LHDFEDLFRRRVDLLEADAITNPFFLEGIEQDRIVRCEQRYGTVMAKQPGVYLHDAAMALAAIERYIAGKDLYHYLRDDLLQVAVERRFEIAAEALNQLSKSHPSLAAKISNLRAIVAFRNVLAHEYAVVNNRGVWELAQVQAPLLRKEIEEFLQGSASTEGSPPKEPQKKRGRAGSKR
jgi:uncharacterized protein with HEPN domain